MDDSANFRIGNRKEWEKKKKKVGQDGCCISRIQKSIFQAGMLIHYHILTEYINNINKRRVTPRDQIPNQEHIPDWSPFGGSLVPGNIGWGPTNKGGVQTVVPTTRTVETAAVVWPIPAAVAAVPTVVLCRSCSLEAGLNHSHRGFLLDPLVAARNRYYNKEIFMILFSVFPLINALSLGYSLFFSKNQNRYLLYTWRYCILLFFSTLIILKVIRRLLGGNEKKNKKINK